MSEILPNEESSPRAAIPGPKNDDAPLDIHVLVKRYDVQHHKLIFEIYEQSEKNVKVVEKILRDKKVVPQSEEQPDNVISEKGTPQPKICDPITFPETKADSPKKPMSEKDLPEDSAMPVPILAKTPHPE